jgi:hypothetical protein
MDLLCLDECYGGDDGLMDLCLGTEPLYAGDAADRQQLAAAMAKAESLLPWSLDEESERLLSSVEAFNAVAQKRQRWDVAEPEPAPAFDSKAKRMREVTPLQVNVPPVVTLMPALRWDFQEVLLSRFLISASVNPQAAP